MNEMYFYHSFPRSHDTDMGIKIIKSIVKLGFLLSPDDVHWPQYFNLSFSYTIPSVRQRRICFSFIDPDELYGHKKEWGPFSLEYDYALINLGAMPVFNIPKTQNDPFFPGHFLLSSLGKATHLLKNEPVVEGLRAIFGLLYPTEDISKDKQLYNYQLREWRITSNTIKLFKNSPNKDIDDIDYNLSPKELEFLKSFFPSLKSADYFKFKKFKKKHVLFYAKRLIVPNNCKQKVESIIKNGLGVHSPKIISYDEFDHWLFRRKNFCRE